MLLQTTEFLEYFRPEILAILRKRFCGDKLQDTMQLWLELRARGKATTLRKKIAILSNNNLELVSNPFVKKKEKSSS